MFKAEFVDNNKPIAVIGEGNSGKTNLGIYLATLIKDKKKYILGYPKRLDGFISLASIEDLPKISKCILVIDEFSKYFPVWEKRSNEKLMETLQFCEHSEIKVILITQLSQFITKQCEAFIPQWAIKQINVRRLKNGSTPSYVLKNVLKDMRITKDYIKLLINEFVWYNEQSQVGETGIYTFPDMNIKKDWKNNHEANKVKPLSFVNADKNSDINTEIKDLESGVGMKFGKKNRYSQ